MLRMREIVKKTNEVRDIILYGIGPRKAIRAELATDSSDSHNIYIGRIDGSDKGHFSEYPKFVAKYESVTRSNNELAETCMKECMKISYELNEKWKDIDAKKHGAALAH